MSLKKKKIYQEELVDLPDILVSVCLDSQATENKAKHQEYLSEISFWLCYGQLLNFFASAAVSVSQARSSLPLMDLLKFMKIPMAL